MSLTENIPPHLTHRGRIRPSLPHGQRLVWQILFVRANGWYPITSEEANYLAKQPANEGNPSGEKLYDAVTVEEAAEIDVQERRSARSGGSALNPVGLDGVVPPEKADRSTADLIARVADSEGRAAQAEERAAAAEATAKTQGAQLAAILAKLKIDPASIDAAPVVSDPIPKGQAKLEEAVPAKKDRPGSLPRTKPTEKPTASSEASASTDAAPAAETPASEG